jgi:hypothetical protein
MAPGYYHSAAIGSKRAAELIDGHRFAKEFKHYLPKYPKAFDPDHPLYHPKIEVSYQSKRDDRDSVPWSNRHELEQELAQGLSSTFSSGRTSPSRPTTPSLTRSTSRTPISRPRLTTER